MRGEELLYRLEEIDPAYLSSAEKARGYRVSRWLALGAAAACLALLGYAGIRLLLPGSEPAENQPALPLLSVAEDFGGGMGFEGYMAYDISELVSANPWQEDMNLTSLPVYRNPVTYDETYHLPSGVAFDKMEALLRQTAGRLGMEDLVITDDSPDEETRAQIQSKMEGAGLTVPEEFFDPTRLLAQAGDTELQVDLHLTAEISFEPARPLPQEYSFTHYSTYKEIEAAAEYLRTQYGELLGMEEPRLNLYGGIMTFTVGSCTAWNFLRGPAVIWIKFSIITLPPSLFIATMRGGFSWCGSGSPTSLRKWGITLSSQPARPGSCCWKGTISPPCPMRCPAGSISAR